MNVTIEEVEDTLKRNTTKEWEKAFFDHIVYDLAVLMFLYDNGEMTADEYGTDFFDNFIASESFICV